MNTGKKPDKILAHGIQKYIERWNIMTKQGLLQKCKVGFNIWKINLIHPIDKPYKQT